MALKKFSFAPGIVKETTAYANEGGWFDGDKVRFRAGLPEKIGGWTKVTTATYQGSCRALHEWAALDTNRFLAIGTHLRYYILWGSQIYDITPVQKTSTLAANPLTAAAPPATTITVHDVAHKAAVGNYVIISGAAAFGPYAAADLNREFTITQIVDADNYLINGGKAAASAVSGGGSTVTLTYLIPPGLDVAVPGTGWGAPPWGGLPVQTGETAPPYKGGWGQPYYVTGEGTVPVNQIRLWSQDNFGEDLVFNIRRGAIYYWTRANGVNQRAVPLTSLPGAPTPAWTPLWAFEVMVSEVDRHVIAIGTNDYQQNFLDPMLVRWSDAENIVDWEPRRDNSAGGQRLSSGSQLLGALRTRQEILIWTDHNLQSMRFIGAPYWFSFNLIAENVSLLCPSGAVNADGRVFWIDKNGFYVYSGQVQALPCTVRDYVFHDFNYSQSWKVTAGHNHNFQEVIWFYPSANSMEVDRYVTYNYVDNVWSIGSLKRTCWLDHGYSDSYPVGAADGYLWNHEKGDDADGVAIDAWIESSDVDLDDGEHFIFVRRTVPDVTFRGGGNAQSLNLSLKFRPSPGVPYDAPVTTTVVPGTKYCWTRKRGRQMVMRLESNSPGTSWRAGAMRFDLQPDGKQ